MTYLLYAFLYAVLALAAVAIVFSLILIAMALYGLYLTHKGPGMNALRRRIVELEGRLEQLDSDALADRQCQERVNLALIEAQNNTRHQAVSLSTDYGRTLGGDVADLSGRMAVVERRIEASCRHINRHSAHIDSLAENVLEIGRDLDEARERGGLGGPDAADTEAAAVADLFEGE